MALTLLALFLAFYIALICFWEDFDYYDNSMFTAYTLKGQDFPMPIWPEEGRFFPFGHQEFNFIRHVTNTVAGYHMLPIVQLLVFFYILLVLDDDLDIATRAAFAVLALLTPSILLSFSALIIPERNVLFFLACLVLSVKRFEQTDSIAWAVAAVVCAQFMIFYKETAFLLLLGFAAGRLILRGKSEGDAGWVYHRLWDKESRLDLCLACLAMLFLLQYFAAMGIHASIGYASLRRHPLSEVVLDYLRVDLLAWLFMAVVIGRIYLILRQWAVPWLLWDALALGGVACFLAYHRLHMFTAYYFAPVDFIAILYVGRFTVLSWEKMRSWSKSAAVTLAIAVFLQDVLFSAFAVFERKNVIHAKAEIASVVEARYRSGGGNVRRLFFPFAGPYQIDEFANYLEYRGVPVKNAVGEAVEPNSVVLAFRSPPKDRWCAFCRSASAPAPGDLVIVLPDDNASGAEASAYREGGELLFSYDPRPINPHWFYPLVDGINIAALRPWQVPVPDRWMDGSVTLWK